MGTIISTLKDGVTEIRLANGTANALTTEVVRELSAALDQASADSRGVLLCGGDKFFSNGADLTWALAQSAAEMRTMFLELGACLLRMMEAPVPIVGAIRGHAIGAGMAVLLACDYRYGATGRVLVGKPEILLGVPNPYYGDQLLRFIAGDFVASDLIYTGRLVAAEEALGLGIFHGVDEKAAVEELALAQLQFLAGLAREAFAETKRMRNGRFCADIREQMSARVARQVEIWNSPEAQALLHAAARRLAR